jgi:transposase-like protein
MPKLKGFAFDTAIIERYRRKESSVEESLMEMYLAGVSVRRVEDIAEALWGERVSASTISDLNKKAYVHIEEWRTRPIEGEYPYLYLDGIWLKRSWGGEYENVSVLVAVGVGLDGCREVLGASEGMKEDTESRLSFLRSLKERGLQGVRLIISDKCPGLVAAATEAVGARFQWFTVHFYRGVFSVVPARKREEVARMLKAIHAQEDREAAMAKAQAVAAKLVDMKLAGAAKKVLEGVADTLAYMSFPSQHWIRIRTNNLLERLNREIRRRTRVVGAFPDGNSALMLVCARLRYVSGKDWGVKQYLNMKHLEEMDLQTS